MWPSVRPLPGRISTAMPRVNMRPPRRARQMASPDTYLQPAGAREAAPAAKQPKSQHKSLPEWHACSSALAAPSIQLERGAATELARCAPWSFQPPPQEARRPSPPPSQTHDTPHSLAATSRRQAVNAPPSLGGCTRLSHSLQSDRLQALAPGHPQPPRQYLHPTPQRRKSQRTPRPMDRKVSAQTLPQLLCAPRLARPRQATPADLATNAQAQRSNAPKEEKRSPHHRQCRASHRVSHSEHGHPGSPTEHASPQG
ncbi:hypothetical protein Pla163_11420 [Planctomycetes bacterium Pla163]|uniref:Uncharacterized protein n=1 Tax=Rohdeia mirabilis TaxID=2528008 RepID=A0A518CXT3_9BACT|nr:hypothetical protein Pla163_11420 [Planctomycetes bacterium Pla163]